MDLIDSKLAVSFGHESNLTQELALQHACVHCVAQGPTTGLMCLYTLCIMINFSRK